MKHFTKFIAVAIMALMSINLGAVDYEKITSADQLSTGDTVVLVIQDAKTTSTLYAVKGNSTNYESVSLSSGKIVNPSAALKWKVTISGTPKTYTFSMKNGSNTYYVNNGGSNTTLSTTSSTATTWTLTAKTNNTFMIARSSATIRYLGWTGSKFGAYATTNFKDQFNLSPAANLAQYHGAISIYKKSSAGSTYTVDYAGGTGATGTAPASHSNLNNGDKITLAANTFSKTGYNFAGWNDGTTTYNAGVQYSVSGSKTMTAQWTAKTYTITLDANGHGEANGSATATYDATTLSSVTGVTANTGYSLNGYFTATSGGTKVINADGTLVSDASGYTESGKWKKDAAGTLYAQYTQSFTITFIDKLQGRDGYTSPTGHTLQVENGATFTFPDALTDGTPTEEQKTRGTCEQQHYHFVGWILSTQESTANNDGHANVKAAGSTSAAVTAAATYYAVWAKEE